MDCLRTQAMGLLLQNEHLKLKGYVSSKSK